MRLIDAKKLKEKMINYAQDQSAEDEELWASAIIRIIDDAPTVCEMYGDIPVFNERPQGEWIIKTGVVSNYSACSLCDFADYRHLHFNYCPGCGARMSFGGKLCGGES